MLIKKKKPIKEVVPIKKAPTSGFNFHNPITQEIENQAQVLVEKKSHDLLEEFNKELAIKKAAAELEIQSLLDEAESQSAKIIDEANAYKKNAEIEIYDTKKLLEKEKIQFEEFKKIELNKSYEEAMAKAASFISELMNYLMTFHDAKRKLIEDSKKEIISIAFDLVKQIIGYEVEISDELLQAQVERAISKVISSKGIIQIYLNPADMVHAKNLENALLKLLDSSVKLVFQKDEKVDKGSCVVNTQGGRLDATFTGQINVLKETLERYLGYKIQDLPEETQAKDGYTDIEVEPFIDDDFDENLSLEEYLLQHSKNVDNNINKYNEIEDEDMSILELQDQDSKELGANDFSDQELKFSLGSDGDDDFEDPDEDLDEDLDEEEDLDDEDDEEDLDDDFDDEEDEEEEELEEEYEENPEEDEGDDRFPEY